MIDWMAKVRADKVFRLRARRIKTAEAALDAYTEQLTGQVIAALASQGVKAGIYITATSGGKMSKPTSSYFRIDVIGVYHDGERWTFKLDTHRCFGVTPDGNLKLGAFRQFKAGDSWQVAKRADLPIIDMPRLVRNAGQPVKPAFCVVKDDGQRAEE